MAKYLLMLYISVLWWKVIDPQGRAILKRGPLVEALTALKEGQSALQISLTDSRLSDRRPGLECLFEPQPGYSDCTGWNDIKPRGTGQ